MSESVDETVTMAAAPAPELPPDAWGAIARTALAAEGDSIQTWARLSLVARAWRDGLKGARLRHEPELWCWTADALDFTLGFSTWLQCPTSACASNL